MPDPIQFADFDLSYEAYLTGGLPDIEPGLDPERYYSLLLRELSKSANTFAHSCFGLAVERSWYAQNRPEFKVYPAIIEALERTHVNIDATYFKMPFPTFMIRFPKHSLRESDAAPFVRAMIVTTVDEPISRHRVKVDGAVYAVSKTDDPVYTKLVIYACFEAEMATPMPSYNYFKFPMIPGATIQNSFENTKLRSDGDQIKDAPEFDDYGYWPSRALYMRLLRIAIGTAFFGIGRDRQKRHSLVAEEKAPRKERKKIAKETGQRTRDVQRPIFVVGKDIELPRYESEMREPSETRSDAECVSCGHQFSVHTKARRGCSHAEGDAPCECLQWDSGRHISYGYIRSGHLHYYAVGSRKGVGPCDYELRWISPTPVRPDLPFGPPKARAIKAPTTEIVSADITKIQNP